jgi:hypothetical protein
MCLRLELLRCVAATEIAVQPFAEASVLVSAACAVY